MSYYTARKWSLQWAVIVWAIILMQTAALAYKVPNVPTKEKLHIIETPHFRVIYQNSLAEAAPVIAEYSEEAYSVLTSIFEWIPEGKIDVLFVDAYDTHNGWATPLPHNTISIFAVGSEQGSSIYQPGNYLRRTVYHELTHLLTMDSRYGYNKFLSSIFGKVVPFGDPVSFATFLFTSSPVLLAPRWFLEGEAIWAETEFVPPGRGLSTFVDMIFRCAFRDFNLLPYSKWYFEIPHWPYGLGVYLYGMRLVQYIYETSEKENSVGDLNKNVARSFLFNSSRAARKTTGKYFKDLAQEMLKREEKIQLESLYTLETLPTTTIPRLTPKGIAVGQSIFMKNKIYFFADEEERRNTLYRYDPDNKKLKKISKAITTSPSGSLTSSQDESLILYTRLNVQDYENVWYEIRRYNTETGKDMLVTDRGRYKAIDLSPTGTRLAAVSQRGGNAFLLELCLNENYTVANEKVLVKVPLQYDLSSPRYSPDGRSITFVEANGDGYWLKLYNRADNTVRILLESKDQIISPTWHPSGQKLIFGSDANGVYNLYEIRIRDGKPPIPLTHVTGGLFFPSFSRNGKFICATGYDGQGPYLTLIPYSPYQLSGNELPKINPVWKGEKYPASLEEKKGGAKKVGQETREKMVDPKKYNSFANSRFDYWSPWLTASTEGVQGGVGASFSDPTGFQELKLLVGWESEYNTKLGAAHYYYRGIIPHLHLYAVVDQEVFPDLLADSNQKTTFDHAEEIQRYGIAVEFPYLKLERQITLKVGYEYRTRNFIKEVEEKRRGVSLSVEPTTKDEGLVWYLVNYFDGDYFGRSSSIEDGRLVSIGGELSRPAFGGELSRSRYVANWNEYLSVYRLKNHIVKGSAAFGYGTGDRTAQGLFGLGGMVSPVEEDSPGIPRTLTLRGYKSNFQTGDRVLKTALAYRFPLKDFSKGREGTFPFYSRQLFAEIFYEGGRTWDDEGRGDDHGWINSYGAEVNYAMKILRYLAFSPGVGIAYTPDRPRDDKDDNTVQFYFTIKGWVNF
jgi:hypothetical protein